MSGTHLSVHPVTATSIRRWPGRDPHPLDFDGQHLEVRRGDASIGVVSLFPAGALGHADPDGNVLDRVCAAPEDVAPVVGAVVEHFIDRGRDSQSLRIDLARVSRPPDEDQAAGRYSARSIQVLPGLEAVRRRPGMYIGSVDEKGLASLVWELVDNVLDLHLAGSATTLRVDVTGDAAARVSDDGPGLPVRATYQGLPFLQAALGRLHAGSTLDGHVPHVHSAGWGVGLAVLCALSDHLTVETHHDGRRWTQAWSRGWPRTLLEDLGPSGGRGSSITFQADPTIFGAARLRALALRPTLRDLAHLYPALSVYLDGEPIPGKDGLLGLLALAGVSSRDGGVARVEDGSILVDVAVVPSEAPVRAWFVNASRKPEGGIVEDGIRAALGDAAGSFAVAVSVLLQDPAFAGPTRDRVTNPEIVDPVARAVRAARDSLMC